MIESFGFNIANADDVHWEELSPVADKFRIWVEDASRGYFGQADSLTPREWAIVAYLFEGGERGDESDDLLPDEGYG